MVEPYLKATTYTPLVAAKLLVPLGKPAPNSPKYFAAVEVVERAACAEWLSNATKLLGGIGFVKISERN
jgi:hypothetical protein